MKTLIVHVSQPHDVYIGRANSFSGKAASIWANPFKIGDHGSRDQVVEKYRDYLLAREDLMALLPTLRGKTLGCWCKPYSCHGDVIADLCDRRIDLLYF